MTAKADSPETVAQVTKLLDAVFEAGPKLGAQKTVRTLCVSIAAILGKAATNERDCVELVASITSDILGDTIRAYREIGAGAPPAAVKAEAATAPPPVQ